jgi:hypothetical protein
MCVLFAMVGNRHAIDQIVANNVSTTFFSHCLLIYFVVVMLLDHNRTFVETLIKLFLCCPLISFCRDYGF